MMKNKIAILFDLDGVIIDTEPQYDIFWKKIGEDYQLGIENFEQKIKGTTLPYIFDTYFSDMPEDEIQKIAQANRSHELTMNIVPVPGAIDFLDALKKEGIKMGLVTSSDDMKLQYVFDSVNIRHYFDTIVSADKITIGKPHPMCYLLAAENLNMNPSDCIVFEDSFHGIQSGKSAGMKVIGLSTTNSEESLKDKVSKILPDFQSFGLEELFSDSFFS